MNINNDALLKQFGKASILKELVETLHPRYKSLPSYNKLFTLLLRSENCLEEHCQNNILSLLLGFNIPGIEERLFPIYWSLSETFSQFIEGDNFVILPGETFQFFNFFDEYKIKNEGRSEPLLIATLPTYAFYTPLLIPSISVPIFKFLNCYNNNHHLAEVLFGPAAIFSAYFTYQDKTNNGDFHFLFKDELLKFAELSNTSKFYIELSKHFSYKAESLSKESKMEEFPDIPNKWNLDKSVKLFKEYISLNIPPSEIYIEGKNEPAKMLDIINASWFYFFENILPNTLQDSQQQNNSHPFIQSENTSSFTNESIKEQEKRRSFGSKIQNTLPQEDGVGEGSFGRWDDNPQDDGVGEGPFGRLEDTPQEDGGGGSSFESLNTFHHDDGCANYHRSYVEDNTLSQNERLRTSSPNSTQPSLPNVSIGNPYFSEQLSNLCAIILRGMETSNIFRKLKER